MRITDAVQCFYSSWGGGQWSLWLALWRPFLIFARRRRKWTKSAFSVPRPREGDGPAKRPHRAEIIMSDNDDHVDDADGCPASPTLSCEVSLHVRGPSKGVPFSWDLSRGLFWPSQLPMDVVRLHVSDRCIPSCSVYIEASLEDVRVPILTTSANCPDGKDLPLWFAAAGPCPAVVRPPTVSILEAPMFLLVESWSRGIGPRMHAAAEVRAKVAPGGGHGLSPPTGFALQHSALAILPTLAPSPAYSPWRLVSTTVPQSFVLGKELKKKKTETVFLALLNLSGESMLRWILSNCFSI